MKKCAPLVAIFVCGFFFMLSTLQLETEDSKFAEQNSNTSFNPSSSSSDTASSGQILPNEKKGEGSVSLAPGEIPLGDTKMEKPSVAHNSTNGIMWTNQSVEPNLTTAEGWEASKAKEEKDGKFIEHVLSPESERLESLLDKYRRKSEFASPSEEAELKADSEIEEMAAVETETVLETKPKETEEDTAPLISFDTLVKMRTISAKTGGKAELILNAGLSNASREYVILGSISGTTPGTYLYTGLEPMPLNWDYFTESVIASINGPFFSNFSGYLDEWGCGKAVFNVKNPLPSEAVGLTHHFAYVLLYPCNFISNPVGIKIEN